jgi:hypothetical protein
MTPFSFPGGKSLGRTDEVFLCMKKELTSSVRTLEALSTKKQRVECFPVIKRLKSSLVCCAEILQDTPISLALLSAQTNQHRQDDIRQKWVLWRTGSLTFALCTPTSNLKVSKLLHCIHCCLHKIACWLSIKWFSTFDFYYSEQACDVST